jgi:hypothetical protein
MPLDAVMRLTGRVSVRVATPGVKESTRISRRNSEARGEDTEDDLEPIPKMV